MTCLWHRICRTIAGDRMGRFLGGNYTFQWLQEYESISLYSKLWFIFSAIWCSAPDLVHSSLISPKFQYPPLLLMAAMFPSKNRLFSSPFSSKIFYRCRLLSGVTFLDFEFFFLLAFYLLSRSFPNIFALSYELWLRICLWIVANVFGLALSFISVPILLSRFYTAACFTPFRSKRCSCILSCCFDRCWCPVRHRSVLSSSPFASAAVTVAIVIFHCPSFSFSWPFLLTAVMNTVLLLYCSSVFCVQSFSTATAAIMMVAVVMVHRPFHPYF